MQVYMLSYRESVEVVKFQQAASREKQGFLSLVQKKGHMVLPVDEVRCVFAEYRTCCCTTISMQHL
jgi:hypothetical protein